MKTLKNQNLLAVVTETTVYLSNLDGKIYKHFPVAHFKGEQFTEEVAFPVDFEVAKQAYNAANAAKKAEREEAARQRAIAEREERRENLINLWNWRKGRIEAFLVVTYCEGASERYNCTNPEGYTQELVFGKEEARKRFEEFKASEKPVFHGKTNDCYFTAEILAAYTPFTNEERLQITSIEDLESELRNCAESVESNRYAPSIEDKEFVVSESRKGYCVNKRRTFGFWLGDCRLEAQDTTANLYDNEFALNIDELTPNDWKLATAFYEAGFIDSETAEELGVWIEEAIDEE